MMTSERTPAKRVSANPAVLLITCVACCYSAVGAAFGVLPVIVLSHMHANGSALGVAMGCYAFTAIPSRTAGGLIMRKTGYRAFLTIAASLLCIATIGTALSPNYPTLICFRLLIGVGVGFMMAVSTAWMVELPIKANVASKLGSVGTVNYIMLGATTPLASFFSTQIGPQLVLLCFSVPPVISVLLCRQIEVIPISPAPLHKRFLLPRMLNVGLVPGLALMLSGIGYASIVSFGIELGSLKGLTWPSLLVFVYAATMVVCRLTITQYASVFVTNPIYTALIFASEAAGLGLLSISHALLGLIIGSMLVGFAMSLIYPLLGTIVTRRSTTETKGANLAFFGSFINLGIGLGSFVLGLWVTEYSLTSAFVFGAGVVLLGSVMSLFVPRLNRTRPSSSEA